MINASVKEKAETAYSNYMASVKEKREEYEFSCKYHVCPTCGHRTKVMNSDFSLRSDIQMCTDKSCNWSVRLAQTLEKY